MLYPEALVVVVVATVVAQAHIQLVVEVGIMVALVRQVVEMGITVAQVHGQLVAEIQIPTAEAAVQRHMLTMLTTEDLVELDCLWAAWSYLRTVAQKGEITPGILALVQVQRHKYLHLGSLASHTVKAAPKLTWITPTIEA